jgi:hypothetical protein
MDKIYVVTELTNDHELNVSHAYTNLAAAQVHLQNAIQHEKEYGMLVDIHQDEWKIKELPLVFEARDQHSELFLEIVINELEVRHKHFTQEEV